MFAIYKKEIKTFFYTMEAYVAISIFLIINSLILWYIPSDFNILHNNKATLLPFFSISPWVFLVLTPAITMKLISYEFLQRTRLILWTKPIQKWKIITAKYLASLTIGIITIIPSLIFVYSICQLSMPKWNIDQGELMGSYLGLVMLLGLYTSIGIFCSSISNNTMITFISTIVIILFLYTGLDILGDVYNIYLFEYLSIITHYESISRGVLDSRDLLYFISFIFGFLYFTTLIIDYKKT